MNVGKRFEERFEVGKREVRKGGMRIKRMNNYLF